MTRTKKSFGADLIVTNKGKLPYYSLCNIRMKCVELWRHVGEGCQAVSMQIFVLKKKFKITLGCFIQRNTCSYLLWSKSNDFSFNWATNILGKNAAKQRNNERMTARKRYQKGGYIWAFLSTTRHDQILRFIKGHMNHDGQKSTLYLLELNSEFCLKLMVVLKPTYTLNRSRDTWNS